MSGVWHGDRETRPRGEIELDAETLAGFVQNFLLDTYEESRPIPPIHLEWWNLVTSAHPRVAIAAPRGHAKSTAINHAYGLAASLFKQHPFQIKVSRTYNLAVEKLRQAKEELLGNEKIKHVFRLKRFVRDTENDFIAEMSDGYRFRMVAIGMEQAIRGLSWGTQRPSLINGDDMEDDEQVMNPQSRDKAMRWVMNTLLPMGSDHCMFRIYGTILHNDSVLMRLLKNPSWKGAIYEACDADISEASLLWPAKFTRERLQNIKDMYIAGGNLAGFNMEYRNIATDNTSGFFRKEDFREMQPEDQKLVDDHKLTFYVGVDFAISTKQRRDKTSFVVGGIDQNGYLHIVDERSGRWDAKQIIDEMFAIEDTWHPDEWYVESGTIQKALSASIELESRERHRFPNLKPISLLKDKESKARNIQARMRSRSVRFDATSSWYAELKEECLQFPRGEHDDRVDALAYLGLGLARMVVPLTDEEEEDMEFEQAKHDAVAFGYGGRSLVTGY